MVRIVLCGRNTCLAREGSHAGREGVREGRKEVGRKEEEGIKVRIARLRRDLG